MTDVQGSSHTRNTRVGRLTAACVRRAGVDGGGVSVLSSRGTRVLLHATDDLSRTIEQLQFILGEGPCIEATATGQPVLVPDLDALDEHTARWPTFAAEMARLDARALFAFPIRVGTVSLGTLDLYRRSPGRLDPDEVDIGLTTVDAVGSALLAPAPTDVTAESYPMAVHRAAGMVMVQLGTGIEEAMMRLRATAFLEDQDVSQVALDVLNGHRRYAKEVT